MKSGMSLKKREFTPESGTVDTYVLYAACCTKVLDVAALSDAMRARL